MNEVFVLAEHRQGKLRDVTFELLTAGKKLSEKISSNLVCLLLGKNVNNFAENLKKYADEVLLIEDDKLENYNSEVYQKILEEIIAQQKPSIVLIGHTGCGVDLAPALSVALNCPFSSDIIDFEVEGKKPVAIRQMYGGKVNARILLKDSPTYILTVRPAAISAEEGTKNGEIKKMESPLKDDITYRKFVEYIEAVVGEVDITQADIIISVGRGIKEEKNLHIVKELADAMGGVLACSRPIVDAGWLPKDRQVGSSGKTVKPKLYMAIGISGAFQHITGMKASDTIIAINKDPEAPIFTVAKYGIVDDLFKVVPILKDKILEIKAK